MPAARICIIIAPTTRRPISTSSSSVTSSCPLALAVETAAAPHYWVHLALWLPLTLALSFGLMQPIKGAIVAWQWAHRMHGFDPQSEPDELDLRPATKPRCDERTRQVHDGRGARSVVSRIVRPKDAATLILVDRSSTTPKVLLGKRHHKHVFMPGKFVFPGGRAEPNDRLMPIAKPLCTGMSRNS